MATIISKPLQQIDLETDWITSFERWLLSFPTKSKNPRAQKTVSGYISDMRHFARYFEKVNQTAFQLAQINSMDMEAFFKTLSSTAKPATYRRKLASMRMLVNYARERGLISYDPLTWVPLVETTQSSPKDLNDDERVKLETACDADEATFLGMRDSIIFYLMSLAGLRIHEAVGLKISDMDLDGGEIHVLGKGKKHRTVKIGRRLAEKIRIWRGMMPASVDGSLVVSEKGLGITTGQARRRFYILRAAAGLNESITPHALRHTFVYRSIEAFMGDSPGKWHAALDYVCKQTGDTPEVILRYYSSARESDMRAAAELM